MRFYVIIESHYITGVCKMKKSFKAFETDNQDSPFLFFVGSMLSFFGGIAIFAVMASMFI